MELTNPDLRKAEGEVISILEKANGPVRPLDLLTELDGAGIGRRLARTAIWHLVDHDRIGFRPDRSFEYIKPQEEKGEIESAKA
jgi:hypothetical protein